ncbi:MAG: isoaspartyl peptidase/L-asparaginase [Gemmatimonadota bacterium]|jgi:beta-aspartyl-peptidase (threonine type)
MNEATREGTPRVEWGLVIHGGVGVLPREDLTPELEAAYLEALQASLRSGFESMQAGGGAVAGVVEAIKVMEDSPLFNAGRGSNFTADGVVSMDASIMVGDTLEAGAVAGVKDVRYPIRLAQHVMEECPHVMLAGEGAEAFARSVGMASETPEFFFTQRRWDDLQAAKAREEKGEGRPNTVDVGDSVPSRDRSGTVGAVALDQTGKLVAGTSTGGSANKKWGRIGDSPVIAAGTYAGSHCGVSCTGWGEYFIRYAVAHDIQARMAYKGLSLRDATAEVVKGELERLRRGLGGVVAMDRKGYVEMCFSTQGMYRGWVDQEGEIRAAIF